MRKLKWQTGGAEGDEPPQDGIAEKTKKSVTGVLNGIFTGGLSTLFGIILMILEVVFRILWFIFTIILPFMIKYIGIPLFILGAIMGLIFTVGHVFFLVAFFVGVFLYMRGIVKVAFPTGILGGTSILTPSKSKDEK